MSQVPVNSAAVLGMADAASAEAGDAGRFSEHVCCPSCGYDWYQSPAGRCSECGLYNGPDLVRQYQAGLRPLPFEYPLRYTPLAIVLTLLRPLAITRAVRGYPPDAARRVARWGIIVAVAAFVILDWVNRAVILANDATVFQMLQRSSLNGPSFQVQIPGARHYIAAAPRLIVPLIGALVTLPLIHWRCRKVLSRTRGIGVGDAERLFAATMPWLAVLLLSWFAARLISLAVLIWCGPDAVVLAPLAWLITLLVGATPWRRLLVHGLTTFGEAPQSVAERSSQALFSFAVAAAVVPYWLCEMCYSVIKVL